MTTRVNMFHVGIALAALAALASCSEDAVPARGEEATTPADDAARPEARRDASSASRPRDASLQATSDAHASSPELPDATAEENDASQPPVEPADAATTRDASTPSESDASIGEGERCTADPAPPKLLSLSGELGTHDPVVIASDGQYFMFQTGRGVATKTSSDLLRWRGGAPVFASNPAWVAQQVPGATDLWAPDISYFGGTFHLYYSVSTFGSNRSCIGHATRDSLVAGSWRDQGPVICSNTGAQREDWNAIDPNVVLDAQQTPWLSFGSFWSGLQLVKLDAQGKRADDAVIAIAGRPNGGAIEAPFVVRRCGYYYLFVSFDRCCAGADSTYRIVVVRSREVTGPYVDKSGRTTMQGGGSPVLSGGGSWVGPGHNAILRTSEGDYNVYHAYSSRDGHPELRISELHWDAEGWPISAGP